MTVESNAHRRKAEPRRRTEERETAKRQRQGMSQEEDEQEENDPRGQHVEIAEGQRRLRDTEEAAIEEEISAEMRTKTKTPVATTQARVQSMDEEEGQEAEEAEAATCENDRRTLRKRKKDSYDQTKRRTQTRVTATAYVERREGRGLCKRRAILMGTATIERIVNGKYEWRDGGMRNVTNVRKRFWAVMHGTDYQDDAPSKRRR